MTEAQMQRHIKKLDGAIDALDKIFDEYCAVAERSRDHVRKDHSILQLQRNITEFTDHIETATWWRTDKRN